ncbi:glucose-6-phosphate dehydrogenase [Oleiagrimonas sp. C23AA]|uniref:glucose-6-phosphate dehydrogenase n=1 Tax=Oleiagrimonas sp. C23AA TaxID=2719047 RepID=UPI00141FFACA|nr:glucose-6-phosphate dehydrogenase [Oleiagrimonas sp. C23AA]NII09294.1 glucose-6-phosphate dehydrogenase [Oleiagrimonas sp. C23AA]
MSQRAAPDTRERPSKSKASGPCLMVIFGAAGDLTHRLITPALYNLVRRGLLPESFAVVGVDIKEMDDNGWRRMMKQAVHRFTEAVHTEMEIDPLDADAVDWLTSRTHYLKGDFSEPATYKRLRELLTKLDEHHEAGDNVLYYLATAPGFFEPVIRQLGKARMAQESDKTGWRRVVVEKPFGHDLASAKALNESIGRVLREDQIFRIDHFLGKETVQNILSFRFANGLFEPIWNRDRIDHVQITAAETVGVEDRGRFYEHTGALRDMVPNHLFQLLALVAMEPPTSFSPEALRQRKAETIAAIRPPKPHDAVRGQYRDGAVKGELVNAYRDEPNVAPDSDTETFVALKLAVDTWRWAGVPFYLRTGKHLGARTTEIAIRFKSAPLAPFRSTAVDTFGPNWLVLHIQPNEGISLHFDVKRPGTEVNLSPVRMDFRYRDWFRPEHGVGYETLLYDCMTGDAALFQDAAMVEAGWRAVQPVLDAWSEQPTDGFPNYASGSAGPASADTLLAMDGGRSWRPLTASLEPPPRRPRRATKKSPAKKSTAKKMATRKRAAAATMGKAGSTKASRPASSKRTPSRSAPKATSKASKGKATSTAKRASTKKATSKKPASSGKSSDKA